MTTRTVATSHRDELFVLALVGAGLILILFSIIAGLFGWWESKTTAPLPNWAENVLVSIATACALKLGDVLAALVTLATGRQVESLGEKLSNSSPTDKSPAPKNAKDAADQMVDASKDERDKIAGEGEAP